MRPGPTLRMCLAVVKFGDDTSSAARTLEAVPRLAKALSELGNTELLEMSSDSSVAIVLLETRSSLPAVRARLVTGAAANDAPLSPRDHLSIFEVSNALTPDLERADAWLREHGDSLTC